MARRSFLVLFRLVCFIISFCFIVSLACLSIRSCCLLFFVFVGHHCLPVLCRRPLSFSCFVFVGYHFWCICFTGFATGSFWLCFVGPIFFPLSFATFISSFVLSTISLFPDSFLLAMFVLLLLLFCFVGLFLFPVLFRWHSFSRFVFVGQHLFPFLFHLHVFLSSSVFVVHVLWFCFIDILFLMLCFLPTLFLVLVCLTCICQLFFSLFHHFAGLVSLPGLFFRICFVCHVFALLSFLVLLFCCVCLFCSLAGFSVRFCFAGPALFFSVVSYACFSFQFCFDGMANKTKQKIVGQRPKPKTCQLKQNWKIMKIKQNKHKC